LRTFGDGVTVQKLMGNSDANTTAGVDPVTVKKLHVPYKQRLGQAQK
jgi:hypothetical protein